MTSFSNTAGLKCSNQAVVGACDRWGIAQARVSWKAAKGRRAPAARRWRSSRRTRHDALDVRRVGRRAIAPETAPLTMDFDAFTKSVGGTTVSRCVAFIAFRLSWALSAHRRLQRSCSHVLRRCVQRGRCPEPKKCGCVSISISRTVHGWGLGLRMCTPHTPLSVSLRVFCVRTPTPKTRSPGNTPPSEETLTFAPLNITEK